MNLPRQLVRLLEEDQFCFLATSYQDQPHVCLMIFTYLPEEKRIVLSSRSDTTKVKHIKKNPAVSLLLYTLGKGNEPPVSCTLYGTAEVLPPEKEEMYRQRHLMNHPGMEAFIQGDNISMIAVTINHATLSDVEDKVQAWSAADALKHDS